MECWSKPPLVANSSRPFHMLSRSIGNCCTPFARSCCVSPRDGSSAMLDSEGTLLNQAFHLKSNSSWRSATRIGVALWLEVWQAISESFTPSLSVHTTTCESCKHLDQHVIATKIASSSHSKMMVFRLVMLSLASKSSVRKIEKKTFVFAQLIN